MTKLRGERNANCADGYPMAQCGSCHRQMVYANEFAILCVPWRTHPHDALCRDCWEQMIDYALLGGRLVESFQKRTEL